MNCHFCDRDVSEYPSVLVDFETGVIEVCDVCMEKVDEPEYRAPMDREGLPEFTGVFR